MYLFLTVSVVLPQQSCMNRALQCLGNCGRAGSWEKLSLLGPVFHMPKAFLWDARALSSTSKDHLQDAAKICHALCRLECVWRGGLPLHRRKEVLLNC